MVTGDGWIDSQRRALLLFLLDIQQEVFHFSIDFVAIYIYVDKYDWQLWKSHHSYFSTLNKVTFLIHIHLLSSMCHKGINHHVINESSIPRKCSLLRSIVLLLNSHYLGSSIVVTRWDFLLRQHRQMNLIYKVLCK